MGWRFFVVQRNPVELADRRGAPMRNMVSSAPEGTYLHTAITTTVCCSSTWLPDRSITSSTL